ncbi:protein SAR DEFICIENT 1-like isoform X1 [Amaranthus tricolor]|uniref:protein SAR DEFICIENT 1-like isoform X1 n=1 Tax=Amaranthus tricolor TaxID=29722 RepID=UPI00258B5618|nr:protein SAR DEFICIENT 1-like isoform X1 [Amaranthus tricolor]
MATKRLIANDDNQLQSDDHQPKEKKFRRMPSFASVIREVMMATSTQCFFKSFEPMLRRVVSEEVERGIKRSIRTMGRYPSLRNRIHAPENSLDYLKLVFTNKKLQNTIFTSNKILDINQNPLQLEVIGNESALKTLPNTLKVEIVVIDGDFDLDSWSVDEFNKNIIKQRSGKPPLVSKEVNYTIRSGSSITLGEVEITDNSSWTRSRKFKLGARVVGESSKNLRIVEALTEAFVVKDQRGESYKKHYPPMLDDQVWRLKKIGKDGKFHERLEEAGIKNVQDFLKLSVVHPTRLKKILGGDKGEMSDKMWDTVLKHARTCNLGTKLYKYYFDSTSTIFLDASCNIFSININGQHYRATDILHEIEKEMIDGLVKQAYENWESLQVEETPINEQFEGIYELVGNRYNNNETQYQYEIVNGGVSTELMDLGTNWESSLQTFY